MNEWISVKDGLPDLKLLVLLFNNVTKCMYIGYRWCDHAEVNNWYVGELDESVHYETISYWMPLPEPPSE